MAHQLGEFVTMGLKVEVTGNEKMHLGVRRVALVGRGPAAPKIGRSFPKRLMSAACARGSKPATEDTEECKSLRFHLFGIVGNVAIAKGSEQLT